MAIWFISRLTNHTSESGNLHFDADGLPDLSRAHSREHMKEWLEIILPQEAPETWNAQTEYLWILSHDVMENDFILVETKDVPYYMLGEIDGAYVFDIENKSHSLPVRWIDARMDASKAAIFAPQFKPGGIVEVTDPDVLSKLHRYIPSLNRPTVVIFRWVALLTLFFELAYFWPR